MVTYVVTDCNQQAVFCRQELSGVSVVRGQGQADARFVEFTNGMLKLFFLPPYSPHLNPDEVVWAHVKRDVAKKVVERKEEMKALAVSALRRIQKFPDLVRSFFGQPELRYITQ